MKKEINSKWEMSIGTWDRTLMEFINVEKRCSEKMIQMEICKKEGEEDLIQFVGGPTGFESYYISSLLKNPSFNSISEKSRAFCICGGTINRWPRVTVNLNDVIRFLSSEGYICWVK